jgi:cell division septum initiation protein DivIVA
LVLLHEAVERGHLLDERTAARREVAMKEAKEIRASTADEAEEILARARMTAGEILAEARTEATEITTAARQRIPLTVGPPNPALAGKEVRRAAQLLLDQARANADGLLSNARQKLEEAKEREALVHTCKESANSRAASLGLLEVGLATREEETRLREQGLRHQEDQLSTLEVRLNREREALETRESMVSQTATDLTQRLEALQQRESTLVMQMDRMLNQRQVSLEQETERKRAESLEAHHVDFRASLMPP